MNGHLFAAVFAVIVATGTAWLWADPKLRSKIRWGEGGTGSPLSNWSFGSWVIAFLLFAGIQFARALEVPLSTAAGNVVMVGSFTLLVVGAAIDRMGERERGGK